MEGLTGWADLSQMISEDGSEALVLIGASTGDCWLFCSAIMSHMTASLMTEQHSTAYSLNVCAVQTHRSVIWTELMSPGLWHFQCPWVHKMIVLYWCCFFKDVFSVFNNDLCILIHSREKILNTNDTQSYACCQNHRYC